MKIIIELQVFNPSSASVVFSFVKDIDLIFFTFFLLFNPVSQILTMDVWVDLIKLFSDFLIELKLIQLGPGQLFFDFVIRFQYLKFQFERITLVGLFPLTVVFSFIVSVLTYQRIKTNQLRVITSASVLSDYLITGEELLVYAWLSNFDIYLEVEVNFSIFVVDLFFFI